ncbi:MAG: hypothetical protein OZSIB_0736 [Candidatus Ozemobacter sibiricus]|jgi:YfiH family protein|uniref:Purine nucleoside phosphorylase n=1 Tax=Candidatus Ozemobacter sibiricus TaxID=2268124 RepID=A0A367ZW69_9BACT|nr:MAG: hypothetical protein OZSIB_0736 [Candidatus Ozemobacter sibiricus]
MHLFRGPGFVAGFSDRADGSLDFSDRTPEEAGRLWAGLPAVAGLGLPPPRFAHQVHSTTLLRVGADAPAGRQGQADALMTSVPAMPIGVFTADCLPVLVVAGEAVMAVHAGWKGTRQDITGRSIAALAEATGVSPARMQVFMGPCIGSCCLELGEEVVEEFRATDPGSLACFARGARWHLDLRGLNVIQCLERGVARAAIRHVNDCTKCLSDRYFSYRQMRGRHGTQFSFIARLPEEGAPSSGAA